MNNNSSGTTQIAMDKSVTEFETFGEHLMIDGYGGAVDKLNSRILVEECLRDLPERLGMRPLMEVSVVWADPNDKKDPDGWTGIVPIAESHISIHTFPGRAFVSADVYTCREGLDVQTIIQYFVDRFDLQDTEVNFVKRGTKYPRMDIE